MARILIISTMGSYPWGGSEYLWAATAKEALIQGHEVLISVFDWSSGHPLVQRLKSSGAHILSRPRHQVEKGPLKRVSARVSKAIKAKLKLRDSPYREVFDSHPDFVLISQGSSYDAASSDLTDFLFLAEVPYSIICQFNSDSYILSEVQRVSIQRLFNKAEHVAFVSEHNRRLAERHLAMPLPNSLVVQNPINLRDHSIVPFPEARPLSFACVARLECLYKGQDVLFESLSATKWKSREWQCRLYGSGPDEDYLKSLAEFYGISQHVQFMGYVNDVRSIWSENHLFVLPSRAEGTPLALVEAMLCGRPGVVTDVGGNADWIQDKKTGFVAEAPTERSFGLALERAWQKQEEYRAMGDAAHEYADSRIDRNPAKSLLQLIANTMSG